MGKKLIYIFALTINTLLIALLLSLASCTKVLVTPTGTKPSTPTATVTSENTSEVEPDSPTEPPAGASGTESESQKEPPEVTVGSESGSQAETTDSTESETVHEHTYTDTVTAPTCTEQGYTTHTCTVCGENYTDSYTEIDPDSHHIVDGVCEYCGYVRISTGLIFAHSVYGTYEVSGIGNCVDTDIVIPSTYEGVPVTSIGGAAFRDCTSLTSITIPDSITFIDSSAFYGCTSLTSISIPNSVTSIGSCAFMGCSNLKSITIPDSVTSISDWAFWGCSCLTSITLPDGITAISWYAFRNCTSLTSITIPDSVTSIDEGAFYGCTSLTSITIPNSVTSIGFEAFRGCTSLTSIAIPDGVTTISESAFKNCKSLASITIPDSVTSIGKEAFYITGYYNNSANWEGEALYIGKHLIRVKDILPGSYSVKEGTLSIADSAFYNCWVLTDITIPNSVTSIGFEAFRGCTKLTDMYYNGTQAQWDEIMRNDIDNTGLSSITIHCTDGNIN